ncbi:hypothetical protein JHK82_044961 [Glycine max]|uniref:Uncharacterized protein n=2 Tax=Glycine subgen. Soja TaxID=1462606 RepID=A0A0R0FQ76_SOYBN|nr:hypothetical protein JHK86_045377 [Glycine max]KAG4941290.1 hypothetical protein JHK87_045161 [Glycine soja]KAG4952093.1 hypothetical protein JHK85_045960 [Glycine max]KAG5099909.1 hypothetical protein JHK82_044961 [Glycine max]KAG5108521.1 hypothetical protein JHK84_045428 [Glycine max]
MNVDDKSSRTTLYQRVYIGMTQIYIHYTAFVLFINVDKMHLNKVYISIFIVWPPKLIRYKMFSGNMVTDSNAVEDFLGYIGVEVQITTSHQYFLGHLWKIIIGKQRFKVRRTMDIKA